MNRLTLSVLIALCAAATASGQAPPRGEPIKPLAPRGEPIQPLKPAPPAAPTAPAAPSAPAESAAPAPARPGADGVLTVGFDQLSAFKYDVPDESPDSPFAAGGDPDTQIPDDVKAFNGKRVALKGFMLPLKVEQGLVTELLLMRDQSMCCYGTVPRINEWVSVRMASQGVKPVMDQAITLHGTLKVGAIKENGYLVGIYQMDGERMDASVGL